MKHSYYHECPNCGVFLDPGEICDCLAEKETREHPAKRAERRFHPLGVEGYTKTERSDSRPFSAILEGVTTSER